MRLTLPSLALGLLLCQALSPVTVLPPSAAAWVVSWVTLSVNNSVARPAPPSVPAWAAQPAVR